MLSLTDVALVLHERAIDLRPNDESLKRLQLSTLAHSADPRLRRRAREELAELLGIQMDGERVRVSARSLTERMSSVGVMLDAYFSDHLHDEALMITTALLEIDPNEVVVLRNHARALARVGRSRDALDYYKKAMQSSDVDSVTANWYAGALANYGRTIEAVIAYSRAAKPNADDPYNFVGVAQQLSLAIRARYSGSSPTPHTLPDFVTPSLVADFVSAALSCPSVSSQVTEIARRSLDRVEADTSLVDRLLELRRTPTSTEGSLQLQSRLERVELVGLLLDGLLRAQKPEQARSTMSPDSGTGDENTTARLPGEAPEG